MLFALVPLLMQVGPAPAEPPVSSLPPEIQDRRAMRNPPPAARAAPPLLSDCLALSRTDPAAALEFVEARRPGAAGLAAAHLEHCRGVALAAQESYAEAAEAFIGARDLLGTDQAAYRARLGAMAGNAALAAGDPDGALGALDQATADSGGRGAIAGEIALDSARALVALGQTDEAGEALAAAREMLPDDAQAWLLSATLARRTGDLAAAQSQIERAAQIDPRNRQIGLEAGVIAVLAGRDEAARKSWQSVVEASPESPEAETARGYLAQLDAPAGDRP